MTNCGRCHTCGTQLKKVLDGEEWCPTCEVYRRYPSHGWPKSAVTDRDTKCPQVTRQDLVRKLDDAAAAILEADPNGSAGWIIYLLEQMETENGGLPLEFFQTLEGEIRGRIRRGRW